MQGIMFIELSRFVDARLGPDAWQKALVDAGLADRIYTPHTPGPDEHFTNLVARVAEATGEPIQSTLEEFGVFVAPDLLGGLYGLLLDPDWSLLDLLEHTEEAIHMVVRARDPTATPPRLRVVRPIPDEVLILYESPRKMCSVAKGIVRGAAEHFGESIEILEPHCMLTGAARCEITVRRVSPGA